jgi:eukaryotic-like serine/threonine-protein kinase
MSCTRCGAETPAGDVLCPRCSLSSGDIRLDDEGSPSPPAPRDAEKLTATGPLRRSPRTALSFSPGEVFGDRYTVVEEIGAGGMGQVYKAIDRRLGRPVALKLLRSDVARGETLQRFRRELALAREVTHSNVCRLHDLGEERDCLFISMEYIEGQTLEDLIQSVGHLSPRQTVALGRQICAGLQAIHDRGIVHRDLKPANVMVDRGGHAILMDFGMAYQDAQDRLTGEGAVLGTLAYLSPEQARGRPTDRRSDVYALGLIFFEMLTGRRPPGDGGAAPMSLRESGERCPPPSRFSPEVPAALDALVLRCLERDPARRYASAEETAAELARLEAALASGVAFRLPRLSPRRVTNRRGLTAAAALVVAMAGVLAAYQWFGGPPGGRRPAGKAPVIAVLPVAHAGTKESDSHLAIGVADMLTAHLAGLPSLAMVSRPAVVSDGRGGTDLGKTARELGLDYLLSVGAQSAGEQLQITVSLAGKDGSVVWGNNYPGSMASVLDLQGEIAEAAASALKLTLTDTDRQRLARPATTSPEAFQAYAHGLALLERPDQEGNVERALEAFQASVERDPRFAPAHAGLGEAYWQQYGEGRQGKDPALVAKAQSAITEALRLDPNQARVRMALALIAYGTGNEAAAVEELHRVIAQQPNNDDAHRQLADILARKGSYDEAVAEARTAVQLRDYWRNQASLGGAQYRRGDYPGAIAAFKRVTELQPDNSRGFQMLGTAYQAAGDFTAAVEQYRRAIQISPDARAYSNLGWCLYVKHRYAEAADAFAEFVRLDPGAPVARRNLGDAYFRLGRKAEARASYLKAVQLSEGMLRVNAKDATTRAIAAACLAKLGRKAEAQRWVAEAVALSPNDGEVLYQQAIVLSLSGKLETAITALDSAFQHGYSRAIARDDDDLDALRAYPGFETLVRGAR